jgi:hypothetical protein
MEIRIKEVAYHTIRWIELSGGTPLVMTSPGSGFHIWGRIGTAMSRDRLRSALRADYETFMSTIGCSPLGDGGQDSGVGTDWYPSGAMIRVPGGRGQLILDPKTLKPDPRYGSIGRDGKKRRKILASTQRIEQILVNSPRIRTDPSRVPQIRVGGETEPKSDRTVHSGIDIWNETVTTVRQKDRDRNRTRTKVLDQDRFSRWIGTGSFDSPGPTRPLAVGVDDRESYVSSAPLPTRDGIGTDCPVELVSDIRYGPDFREMMEAAESSGIVIKGSNTEFSAARKLAWRARSLGISSHHGLKRYIDPILVRSELAPRAIAMIEKESVTAFDQFSYVVPMKGVSNRLETDVTRPTEPPDPPTALAQILAPIPGVDNLGSEAAIFLTALIDAGSSGLSSEDVDSIIGDRRVSGTRKRVSAALKRALVGHQLVKRTSYVKGRMQARFLPTVAGWATYLVARLRSPECRVVDLTQIPRDLIRGIKPHVYRLGGGEIFDTPRQRRIVPETCLTADVGHAIVVEQQSTGPPAQNG